MLRYPRTFLNGLAYKGQRCRRAKQQRRIFNNEEVMIPQTAARYAILLVFGVPRPSIKRPYLCQILRYP